MRPGEPAPLAREHELDLLETLRDSYPDDHQLSGHLWNRQAITDLVHRRYGLRMTVRSVARQLRCWGLGPRTPAERACSLCVGAVVAWLTREYPRIIRHARATGAQVCWAGRTRMFGVAPAAEVISAVTTRGSLRFAVLSGRADAPMPVGLLTRLAAHEQRPVHVIMDGSFASSDWPKRTPAGVVLHPMPSCARGAD